MNDMSYLTLPILFLILFFLLLVSFNLLIGSTFIYGDSMAPTINEGDLVFAYRFQKFIPQRGDIILFQTSKKSKAKRALKRIVAIAGDEVEIKAGFCFVNKKKVKSTTEKSFEITTPSLIVPENQVYVLGDNLENSFDSRFFGPISIALIQSKVIKVIPGTKFFFKLQKPGKKK